MNRRVEKTRPDIEQPRWSLGRSEPPALNCSMALTEELREYIEATLDRIVRTAVAEAVCSRRSGQSGPAGTRDGETPKPESFLLNCRETAKFIGICAKTLHTITRRGELPCLRIGGAVRYDKWDILAWVEAKKYRPKAGPT